MDPFLLIALIFIPIVIIVEIVYWVWLPRRRRTARKAQTAAKPKKGPPPKQEVIVPLPPLTDEEVDQVLAEVDNLTKKVLGDTVTPPEEE